VSVTREQVCLLDEHRNYVSVSLEVERVIDIKVDCGCWQKGHSVGHLFQVLVTRGGAYIRAEGDHAYRAIDMQGPITISIEKVFRP
jgi:hypothetical protein